MNNISDKSIKTFLEDIPNNLKRLEFFDKVYMSNFIVDYQINDIYEIDKKYFKILNEIYREMEKKYPELEISFIEYVKTKINRNIEDFPF